MDTGDKFTEALIRVFEDAQPVVLTLSKRQLWCVIATIQLACRHPKFTGPTRDVVENMAKQFGDQLSANDPDLKMLLEMGWHQEYDEVKK